MAVAFPNTYGVAMSNLGYHAVLRAFLEAPGFSARRVFWEDGAASFPDGGRSLSEFDVIAVSVSYQPDLVRLARLLGTLPAGGPRPLLLGGGAALTINPEPAALLLDLIALGDGEPVFPPLLALLLSSDLRGGREELLRRAASLPGLYVPSLHQAVADGPYLIPSLSRPISRAVLDALDRHPAVPAAVARDTEFGNLFLLEVSRGCGGGCRFCASAQVAKPVRYLSLQAFREQVTRALPLRKTVGLVGTAVSDHPGLLTMAAELAAAGGAFSPSSLRADRITAELARALADAGHRTVSLAPEAGREALRCRVGKRFTDEGILRAADLLQEAGIPHLKLYFMLGLPGEEDGDAEGIGELALGVRERMLAHGRPRGRMGELTLNLTPFVPKPHTAFEREPMADDRTLARRLALVKAKVARAGIKVQAGSARAGFLDAMLSLGDRRLGPLLAALPEDGITPRQMEKAWAGAGKIVFSRREGPLPWEKLG